MSVVKICYAAAAFGSLADAARARVDTDQLDVVQDRVAVRSDGALPGSRYAGCQKAEAAVCVKGTHEKKSVCANEGKANQMLCLDLPEGFACATPGCLENFTHTFKSYGGTTCHCGYSSAKRESCCATSNMGGMGTGTFCGNDFKKDLACGGETPVCCTSHSTGSVCCPTGSMCSSSCGKDGGQPPGRDGGRCMCLPPPEPSDASRIFSLPTAKAFAMLTKAAYCGPDGFAKNSLAVLDWTCEKECAEAGIALERGSIRRVAGDDKNMENATFALVGKFVAHAQASPETPKTGDCVISVMGTSNAANWKRNFEMSLARPGKWLPSMRHFPAQAKFHSGFVQYWTSLVERAGDGGVIKAVADLGCGPGSGKRVFVTGVSLGAGVALVAMMDLKEQGHDVGISYVYGMPRAANKQMIELWRERFGSVSPFRMVDGWDPIPRTPPKAMGYRHVGAEVYFPYNWPGMDLDHVICERPDDRRCSFRINVIRTAVGGDDHVGTPLVDDHVFQVPNFCGPVNDL